MQRSRNIPCGLRVSLRGRAIMIAEERFASQPKVFWANVRLLSQLIGYTKRGVGQIKVPSPREITAALIKVGLEANHLFGEQALTTPLGRAILEYFEYRAEILNNYVEPRLMDRDRSREVFEDLRCKLSPTCPLPMNKQRGDKKAHAYLTGITNMLVEAHSQGVGCDYDPRQLTTITRNGRPLRTLARRVDGAFPSVVNPMAIWEIKEYYYTTTFGSRVADGIYETLLDGMELEELKLNGDVSIKHYLIIDSHYTWWVCGRSYLCRIVDLLNMGYLDEVLFGYEVVEKLPSIVQGWVRTIDRSRNTG